MSPTPSAISVLSFPGAGLPERRRKTRGRPDAIRMRSAEQARLRRLALDVNGPVPAHAHHLRDAERVVAIGFVSHRAQARPHVARFNDDDRQACSSRANQMPIEDASTPTRAMRARVPGVPVALRLAPGPAHNVLAHRAAEQHQIATIRGFCARVSPTAPLCRPAGNSGSPRDAAAGTNCDRY